MFIKQGIVYSEAGHYLYSHTKKLITFQSKGNLDDFEEFLLDNIIEFRNNRYYFGNGIGTIKPVKIEYGALKAQFIKMRYSNDDQIAIMLNKDNSEEDEIYYNKMQEWRDWSGEMAKKIVEYEKNY